MGAAYNGSMLIAPVRALAVAPNVPNRRLLTKRTRGTSGWMSSWGTNAHGEIADCPPPAR